MALTADDYRTCIRGFGLTPVKASYEGSTLHVDREGQHHLIPDPDTLSPDERPAMIDLIKWKLGINVS